MITQKCWIHNDKLDESRIINTDLLGFYLNDGWIKGRGKKFSDSQRGDKNPMYGKEFSEEHKRKISESSKGRIKSEETRKKLSNAHKGKIFTEEHKRNISKAKKGKKFSEKIKKEMSKRFKGKNNPMWGKKRPDVTGDKNPMRRPEVIKKMSGKNNPLWKGGGEYAPFDTYAHQIDYAEEVRNNNKKLEVKCTYCGKWFIPKVDNVISRIKALNGKMNGEARLYCSDSCKTECPIYRKIKYSAEENNTKQYSREVQPELRQLVFERDRYGCQKCSSTKSLHCHHKEGIRWNPLESADIDICITLCKNCHIEVHKKDGCGYYEMQCREAV